MAKSSPSRRRRRWWGGDSTPKCLGLRLQGWVQAGVGVGLWALQLPMEEPWVPAAWVPAARTVD